MANTQTFQRLAPPGRGAMAAKRLFDIVCAACGLVVLSPGMRGKRRWRFMEFRK